LTGDDRSLAKTHIEALGGVGPDFGGRKPAIIRDCGHPSKDFIKRSQDKEIKYVMRARKRFNSGIDRMRSGGGETRISEGALTRAMVFRLASGEREALTTNLGKTRWRRGRSRNCITSDGLWR
jgi:hypothetical protein